MILEKIHENIEARILRPFADAQSVVDVSFDFSADDKSNQNKLDILKEFTKNSTMVRGIWICKPNFKQTFVVALVVSYFSDALQIIYFSKY